MTENEVAKPIVDAAYRIHTTLGRPAGVRLRNSSGLRIGNSRSSHCPPTPIPIAYQDTRIEVGFRADLLVENKVIVEIKSVEALAPIHKKQLLTHLRLADKRLGMLIKDGITRIANGMPD